ncbi:MAG: family ATPase [Acidobacteriota bacterium]|nr:family ATPase [Acidobacteriota bacterium]
MDKGSAIDYLPRLLIEVKVSDSNFSPSLFRFHESLKSAKPIQVVYDLRNKKSSGAAAMVPVHEFLAHLDFSTPMPITS